MHDSSVKQGNRGPWNFEKLWHPYFAGQAAYIVPTFTNFADGPSGLCHYPGIGLPDKYKDCSSFVTFTAAPTAARLELRYESEGRWLRIGPAAAFPLEHPGGPIVTSGQTVDLCQRLGRRLNKTGKGTHLQSERPRIAEERYRPGNQTVVGEGF